MADLRELRSSLAAFAAEVGYPLTDWQVAALGLEARTTVVQAPRQSGKSRSLAVLALWWAFRRREQRVLIVSAGDEPARRLLAEVRTIVMGAELLADSVLDEVASLLTLSNGSEIRSVPASERQVRGWAVDLLLIDEAAMVPSDLLLGAAIPTTAARPDARIVLASSPATTVGPFYDFAVRGEGASEHVRTFRWRLTDATWISPSVIASARESLSPGLFRCEFEGEFHSGSDVLIPRTVLDRATLDYTADSLATALGPATVMAGIDWGARRDRTALVCLGRFAGPDHRFGVRVAHRWPEAYPVDQVIAEVSSSPATFAYLAAESNAMQHALVDMLFKAMRRRPPDRGGKVPSRRAPVLVDEDELEAHLRRRHRARGTERVPVRVPWAAPLERPRAFSTNLVRRSTTNEMKATAYGDLARAIEDQRLLLPASATDLLRELAVLRIDMTPTGLERIEAPSGGFDDLCDAAMLSTIPYVAADRRWRTRLSAFSNPDRWLGSPPEQELDGLPTVTSGGGVVVPRRPVWASVAGGELTWPPGLAAHEDPAAAYFRRQAEARRRVQAVNRA